jgi:crossover junction endodeoxyribonuclease RusA
LATGLAISAEPIYLHLLFRFRRPKGHWNAKGELKASAPKTITTRPDIDKLARSTLDGLTGVLFHDDAQVAFLVASKEYCLTGELEGCQIEIREIKD